VTLPFLIALALAQPEPVIVTSSHPRPPPMPACTHRPSPAGTDLMVIGLYRGRTLSNVWVGNPDQTTNILPFRMAPGPPIHLVISGFEQTVYRFSGATARIRRLTIIGHMPSAVAGLPRARVEFAAACLTYNLFADGSRGAEAVSRLFGRAPVSIVYEHSLIGIRVDQQFQPDPFPPRPPRTGDPETGELNQFTPTGVADVDPRLLISAARTGRYITLPQEAGVRQLVRSGALVPSTRQDSEAWEAAARALGAREPVGPYGYSYGFYRATRPIGIPAGLCGSHLIRIYVRSETWISGDACHSTFYHDDGTLSDASTRARARTRGEAVDLPRDE